MPQKKFKEFKGIQLDKVTSTPFVHKRTKATEEYYKKTLQIVILLAICGPVMCYVLIALGADPLDGFAGGGYYNIQIQDILLKVSYSLIVLGWAGAFLTSVVRMLRSGMSDDRYIFIVLGSIVGTPAMILWLLLKSLSI